MAGRDYVEFICEIDQAKQIVANCIKSATGEEVDLKFITVNASLNYVGKWKGKDVRIMMRYYGERLFSILHGPIRPYNSRPFSHDYPDAMSLVESVEAEIVLSRTFDEHWKALEAERTV